MDERLAAVKGRLEALLEPDQRLRGEDRFKAEDWAEQRDLDRENVAALSRIVETHGWPTERVFGEKAALAAFLALQHAPLAVQERYLPLLQAAERGDAPKTRLAFLLDRVRRYRNEPQLYGTQLRPDKETGRLELYPLQGGGDVDLRRAEMGLEPLKAYRIWQGSGSKPPLTADGLAELNRHERHLATLEDASLQPERPEHAA